MSNSLQPWCHTTQRSLSSVQHLSVHLVQYFWKVQRGWHTSFKSATTHTLFFFPFPLPTCLVYTSDNALAAVKKAVRHQSQQHAVTEKRAPNIFPLQSRVVHAQFREQTLWDGRPLTNISA